MPRNFRDPKLEQFWRRHLSRQPASGLTTREYCRKHALQESSFYAWRRIIRVDTELDLSTRTHRLDVVIIRGDAPLDRQPPDGFEQLARYNVVTFKSHQQALDSWAIHELVGHYVNYCKRERPAGRERLKGLSADEMVRALPPEMLEALKKRMRQDERWGKP